MKLKHKLIPSTAAALVLLFAPLAQASPDARANQTNYTRDRGPRLERTDQLGGSAKASTIIGLPVKNYQDERLGKVEDLAVDMASGRIVQVILSAGGFLGLGDTLTAVPPGALHYDVADKVLHLDADKEKLKNAPKFDAAKWEESTRSNRVTEVYAYYGEQPYFLANADGYAITTSATSPDDLKIIQTLPRRLDGTINTDDGKAVEKSRNVEAGRHVAETHDRLSTRNPDGTWTREYYPNANGTNSSGSSLGYVQLASQVMGKPVKNRQDEKLGRVENLMVDLAAGRIVAVIISSGGFLGIGNELSAIPPTALRFTPARDTLQIDASKELLSEAPHFMANQWPDFNQPRYVGEVYRAYKVEPYFNAETMSEARKTRRNLSDRIDSTPDTKEPDNTASNVRDRQDRALTPLDQGNNKADVATTAQIRKEIIGRESLSVNAKNVKIITANGQVTLRGPVNTDEEKRLIGEIAVTIAGLANVDNQLEVKSTETTSN